MSDEAEAGSPYQPVLIIVGLLAAIGVLWWMRGGPQNGVPKNMFLAPSVPTPQATQGDYQDMSGQ